LEDLFEAINKVGLYYLDDNIVDEDFEAGL
jgi:hypothetical protein